MTSRRPADRSRAATSVGRLRHLAGASGGAVAALAALVILNAVFTPNFGTAGTFWNILLQLSIVLLVAVGMTLVIATGGVDLSVGSVMAVAAAVVATQLQHGVVVAVVAGMLAALAIGLLNGLLIAHEGLQPIVVTLATLIAGRGLAQVLSHEGQLVPISDAAFLLLGRGHLGRVPAPVIAAAVAVVLAAITLRRTPFGRHLQAVGGNRVAARLAGVPVQSTLVRAYAICGLFAGVAGMLEASRLAASDAATIGLHLELDAIAATVVGGTALAGGRATIFGTVAGALVMQVIATSFNMLFIPYAWSLVLKAAIILAAVYVQRPTRV